MKSVLRSRVKILMFPLLLIGLPMLACFLWYVREQHQYALNRQLIDSLVHDDANRAIRLVEEGADPNTPYDPPKKPTLPDLWNYLIHHQSPEKNDSITALQLACGAYFFINIEIVRDPYPEHPELVGVMLQHGGNIVVRDPIPTSLLELSIMNRYWNISSILLARGCNPNTIDKEGEGVLRSALRLRAPHGLIHDLLAHGANPNAADATLGSALMIASEYSNDAENVRLLLEAGADVSTKDGQGKTALHGAFYKQTDYPASPIGVRVQIVRLLLEHGADPNVRDNEGHIPADVPRLSGHEKEYAPLIDYIKHYKRPAASSAVK